MNRTTHHNKAPDHLPAGTGIIVGEIEPEPGVQIQTISIPAPEPEEKKKEKYRNEKTHHKAAFDFYCAMGPERTIAKVAEALKKNTNNIGLWSADFNWVARAREFDKKSEDRKYIEKEIKILRMQADNCIEIDLENGKEKLTGAGMSAEKQNLRARTMDLLTKMLERAVAAEAGGTDALTVPERPSNGSGRQLGGTMVNVIIKK